MDRQAAADKPRDLPVIMAEPAAADKTAARCGEVMGRKTAECAAICCCCPCAVVDLVIFTVVKLPAGLCRKAMRKRRSWIRRRRMLKEAKKGGEINGKGGEGSWGVDDGGAQGCEDPVTTTLAGEVEEEENEMWARFYGAGFWRSPSQKEINSN